MATSMVAQRQTDRRGKMRDRKEEGSGLLIVVDDGLALTKPTVRRDMGGGGGGDVRGRRPSTAVRSLVGRWQGLFAQPVKVRRVATGVWVWTSMRGRETGGRSGAPAVVPGRLAARAGARDVARGRERVVLLT
jgi:hypothetical protein